MTLEELNDKEEYKNGRAICAFIQSAGRFCLADNSSFAMIILISICPTDQLADSIRLAFARGRIDETSDMQK